MRGYLQASRIKPLASIEDKLRRNRWQETEWAERVSDLVGFRIVCNNSEDVQRVKDLVTGAPRLRLSRIQDYISSPQSSGYRGLHLDVTYDVMGPEPTQVRCEIQVRTLAQHMWASLAHHDLYKQGESLPTHIYRLSQRLSSLLAVADDIAQDIREQASRPLAGQEGTDDDLGHETLAFIYQRAFGKDPPDYAVEATLRLCQELRCFRLDAVDRALNDSRTRTMVTEAYEGVARWEFTEDEWFELCPYVAVGGPEEGIRRAEELARRQRDEVEAIARSEVLSELPETFDEFLEDLGSIMSVESSYTTYDLADMMGALKRCLICDAPIIDVDAFVEEILDHYKTDEDPDGQIAAEVMNSGLEVGDPDNDDLCSYHGYVMSRD